MTTAQALPRARVIRRRRVFDAARNKGRRVSNRYLALNFLPHDPARPDPASVAFLTPKRVGPPVKRNQLRRRMREIYRRCLALPTETAYLIWVARPPALELDFEGLKKCMTELRRKSLPPV
jgi:ribonuclease P protein component